MTSNKEEDNASVEKFDSHESLNADHLKVPNANEEEKKQPAAIKDIIRQNITQRKAN